MFNRFPLVVLFKKKVSCAESCAKEMPYFLYTLSIPLV